MGATDDLERDRNAARDRLEGPQAGRVESTGASAEAARTVLAALPGATTVADDASTTITIILGTSYTGVESVVADVTAASTPSSSEREDDAITDPTTADKVRCD